RIAGRCVTKDGTPVAGIIVGPSLAIFVAANAGRWGHGLPGTFTDAGGGFELRNLPRADLVLNYSGDDIVPGTAKVDEARPLRDQQTVVARRCHLRVQIDPARGVQSFRVLDAGGAVLPILELAPGSSYTRSDWPLTDGCSGVLSVSEAGVTVVLEGKGGEIAR